MELRRASFAEQDKVVDRWMKRYQIEQMAIDQTGMGEKTVEDYQRLYGESVAEGVTFSAPTNLSLATIGKQKFEARKIRIPARAEVRQDCTASRSPPRRSAMSTLMPIVKMAVAPIAPEHFSSPSMQPEKGQSIGRALNPSAKEPEAAPTTSTLQMSCQTLAAGLKSAAQTPKRLPPET